MLRKGCLEEKIIRFGLERGRIVQIKEETQIVKSIQNQDLKRTERTEDDSRVPASHVLGS